MVGEGRRERGVETDNKEVFKDIVKAADVFASRESKVRQKMEGVQKTEYPWQDQEEEYKQRWKEETQRRQEMTGGKAKKGQK